ncbi:hypothetical protein GE21DRAFT_1308369 [Neurospora crassa]|nr:hypothetical protein GE21DRAFT_1308369 [Neurospora crassa]
MKVDTGEDSMEMKPSELISVSKLGDTGRSRVPVDDSTIVDAQKPVETWGSKFWKEWRLGRHAGFRQALCTSMWF